MGPTKMITSISPTENRVQKYPMNLGRRRSLWHRWKRSGRRCVGRLIESLMTWGSRLNEISSSPSSSSKRLPDSINASRSSLPSLNLALYGEDESRCVIHSLMSVKSATVRFSRNNRGYGLVGSLNHRFPAMWL